MTATNVVSLNFKSEKAMQEFIEMYERDSLELFPEALTLMMIKTTDTNCLGISIYPDAEIRDKSRKHAESTVLKKLSHLFQEDFKLTGEVVVNHVRKPQKL